MHDAICLVVLFFCHFIVLLLFFNEINGDGDGLTTSREGISDTAMARDRLTMCWAPIRRRYALHINTDAIRQLF